MSTTTAVTTQHPLDRLVRFTLTVALVVFVWTIGIGILNGIDAVEFSRQVLLSHLHGGTLGWMTLGILAAAQWLFVDRGDPLDESSMKLVRGATLLAAAAIPLYVFAFATTNGIGRPIGGSFTLVALIAYAVWAFGRTRHVTLTVPHVLVLLGLTSSMIGGSFGVINGLAIALDWTWVPETFFGAHPGTMEVGFVIPAAVGVAEWVLRRGEAPQRPTRAGWVQALLLAGAFVWVLIMILAEQDDLIPIGILLGIAATVVFFVRLWSQLRAASLVARNPNRHALMAGVFVAVTFIYAFWMLGAAEGNMGAVPPGRAISFIHLLAIGGTTNALLAFVIHVSRLRTEPSGMDDAVFWGVNIGLIGFVVALTTDVRGLIMLFVPIMGLALLLAIGVHIVALRRGARQGASAAG